MGPLLRFLISLSSTTSVTTPDLCIYGFTLRSVLCSRAKHNNSLCLLRSLTWLHSPKAVAVSVWLWW